MLHQKQGTYHIKKSKKQRVFRVLLSAYIASVPSIRSGITTKDTITAAIVPKIEDRGIDEIYIDLTELDGETRVLAQCIKQAVRDATGFCTRVSVGDSGLLVGRISPLLTFDGYVDAKATEQKILTDVFKRSTGLTPSQYKKRIMPSNSPAES